MNRTHRKSMDAGLSTERKYSILWIPKKAESWHRCRNVNKMNFIFSALFCILAASSLNAVDIDPAGAKIKQGVERYKSGDFPGSLDSFESASRDFKEDRRLDFNKGTAQFKSGDFKSALRNFESAAASEDKSLKTESFYNLGNTYNQMGDKKSAIKSYMRALKESPDFAPARKNLELIRRKEEKPPEDKDKQDDKEDKQNQNPQNSSGVPKKDKRSGKEKQKDRAEEEQLSAKDQEKRSLSREEAERILESARQDKIRRKKAQSRRPNSNDIFW